MANVSCSFCKRNDERLLVRCTTVLCASRVAPPNLHPFPLAPRRLPRPPHFEATAWQYRAASLLYERRSGGGLQR